MKPENLSLMRLSTIAAMVILVLGVTFSLLAGPQAAGSGNPPLRTVADIPMPGPAVRFDYQSLDQDQGRLYISHMNADQLVVFDTTTRHVVGEKTNAVSLARERNRSTVVWDYIAVYAPGTLLQDAPPKPIYSDNPVRDAISGAKESIQRLLEDGKTQAGGEE